MVIDMNEARLETIEQIREFLAGTTDVAFGALTDESSLHTFVATVLKRFNYFHLSKGQRGVLFTYLQRLTRYSRQHLSRLIARYRQTKALYPIRRANRTSYARKYGPEDVALLAELDCLHDTLSGPTTKALLIRAYQHFGDARYTRLAGISVAHLYNLRASTGYRKQRRVWTRTRPTPLRIGVRRAPAPNGLPGYIRIDTVHQGNQDGFRGVYHINAIDIVTQWQLVAAVERISEAFLLPVIALLLEGFPFAIRGFHSDSGSEYINQDVAKLLEKLRVEFTKSRPRQTNDNALAECKNGAIIRKLMGYSYIPQKHAAAINRFYSEALNPYLNFHRPCYFAIDTIDAKGKIRKTYPHDQIMTPWDRLQSVPSYQQHLKPGIRANDLQQYADAMSDNDAAKHLQQTRKLLFQSFTRRSQTAA
jgi:transposase InsO family protein